MAPGIFSKFFDRRSKWPVIHPRNTDPNAIGIYESSCEVTDKLTNKYMLPVKSPKERQRQRSRPPGYTQHCSPQRKSLFFTKLPRELRDLVYLELFGGRRVHIEYDYQPPNIFLYPSDDKIGKKEEKNIPPFHWQWKHIVCQKSDEWEEDKDRVYDTCGNWAHEAGLARDNGWTEPPPGTKLKGVELLRTCQRIYEEAVVTLYSTTTFVTGERLDTPFVIPRILEPNYLPLIASMDIFFRTPRFDPSKPITDYWWVTWPAFFDLFKHSYVNVCRLRLTIAMTPLKCAKGPVTAERIDSFMAPFYKLAKSRKWTELVLVVCPDWYEILETRAAQQNVWKMRITDYNEIYGDPRGGIGIF